MPYTEQTDQCFHLMTVLYRSRYIFGKNPLVYFPTTRACFALRAVFGDHQCLGWQIKYLSFSSKLPAHFTKCITALANISYLMENHLVSLAYHPKGIASVTGLSTTSLARRARKGGLLGKSIARRRTAAITAVLTQHGF